MIIKRAINPLDENTYLIFGTESVLVIDPGIGFEPTTKELQGLPVSKIILTHGHFDHICGAKSLAEKYGATVYAHTDEAQHLSDLSLCDPIGTGLPIQLPTADVFVNDGDIIDFEDQKIEVIHTPGHTPGSICLLADKIMFSGDTVFQSSIGRTDLPSGSMMQMRQSLKRLAKLDKNYTICCGHGPNTTLEQEKSWNPYLRGL
jgi:glyoxylase-like metal-dependent hydrolase (beta-lactamase superfamily II)